MKILPPPAPDCFDGMIEDLATINGVAIQKWVPDNTPKTELILNIWEMPHDPHGPEQAYLDMEHFSEHNRFSIRFEAATKERALKFLADLTTAVQALPEVGIPAA